VQVHGTVLAIVQKRKEEKEKLPLVQQQDYHALRVGFGDSGTKGTVLTNHVAMRRLPTQLWKYNTSGIPSNTTRKKKQVLIKTMIHRMSFLDNNRPQFTYVATELFILV